ncbi:MAG TPA: hypothetical protein VG433_02120, partial [Pirellulales bacterium]|nr:hypothetical protein [Pirellulales bacterium]
SPAWASSHAPILRCAADCDRCWLVSGSSVASPHLALAHFLSEEEAFCFAALGKTPALQASPAGGTSHR